MAIRFPALLADPAPAERALWLTNARLFDGTDAPVRDGAGVLVEDGRIARVGQAGDGVPEHAVAVDLAGRTLMPGIVNCHVHAAGRPPDLKMGAEQLLPGVNRHFLATKLRESLRYGVTTVRDMGSYGAQVMETRQAMRYGAFRGARLLTCGLIISATAPGAPLFAGMYREVDGPDEVRKGVREQIRFGADFIKVMATGARSVEYEAGINQAPAGGAATMPIQLTREEMAAAVEEASRMGYEVVAHAEGLEGCAAAIELGMRTIEHGMYLNRRPDLLAQMAEQDVALVPTFSSSYGFGGRGLAVGLDGPHAQRAIDTVDAVCNFNITESDKTIKAAHAAGAPIALGADGWQTRGGAWIEILRMIHHGLPARAALVASTSAAAHAIGLDEHVGSVREGLLADLMVVDGDPIANPELLGEADRIWLVLQLGEPVAGAALEVDVASLAAREPALA